MTKKCFAAIKTAQENSVRIKEITDAIDLNDSNALYNALMEIKAMNDRYVSEFSNVDPYWKKPEQISTKEYARSKVEELF